MRLRVTLHKAEGLKAADWLGKSDPYCIVELGDRSAKSSMHRQTLDPDFGDEAVEVAFDPEQDYAKTFRIRVMDWDPPPKWHDPLGHLDVHLAILRETPELFMSEKLVDGENGKIEFSIRLQE